MTDKICNWLNKNKNKDRIDMIIGKLLYKIFSISWLNEFVTLIIGFILQIFYKNKFMFVLIIIGFIGWLILNSFINKYKDFKNNVRVNSDLVLSEIISLMIALDDHINEEKTGKGLFEFTSMIVTDSMYKVLKDITNSEVRISVIQQFREYNYKRKCMMISRKSKKRRSSHKEKMKVEYYGRNDYYYLKILQDNEETYIYIDKKEEIDRKFHWDKNKRKSDIYQYIGLAKKIETDDIAFLLQIDAMEKDAFGKNKDELEVFSDNYVYPYVKFLSHAYNMERILKGCDKDE